MSDTETGLDSASQAGVRLRKSSRMVTTNEKMTRCQDVKMIRGQTENIDLNFNFLNYKLKNGKDKKS